MQGLTDTCNGAYCTKNIIITFKKAIKFIGLIVARYYTHLLYNSTYIIGKLQDPAAARLTFVVVAALGVEECRCMLSGSLPQCRTINFRSFSLWTPQPTD